MTKKVAAALIVMLLNVTIPAGLAEVGASQIEQIDNKRVQRADDGNYTLDEKNIGVPKNAHFWNQLLDQKKVIVWSPEHRSLTAFSAMQLKDGRILVVSGGDSVHYPCAVSNFVNLKKWTDTGTYAGRQPEITAGPKPNFARLDGEATLLTDGRVLITGGGEKFPDYVPVMTAEIYDPVKNQFTACGTMNHGRRNFTATAMSDGKVLLAGGMATKDGHLVLVEDAEVFDPKTGSFQTAGKMIRPRFSASAVALSDGRVMIIGGSCIKSKQPDKGGQPVDTSPDSLVVKEVEYFNPRTNSFDAGPLMPAGKTNPMAILLPDGKVLVFGGASWQTVEGTMDGRPAKYQGFFGDPKALIIQP